MKENKENVADFPNMEEVGMQRSTAASIGDAGLICYGCAHSIGGEQPPSGPSGERPCLFCVRNPKRDEWQQGFEKQNGRKLLEWYDGSPIAFYPMDAYQPIDMVEQQSRWHRRDTGDLNWNELEGGLRFG